MSRFLLILPAFSLFTGLATAQPAAKPVDFQREVRPILSDNCFHCHGPDATTRMAGLRLDQQDAALAVGKRGAALVPGKPGESLLYQRITAAQTARRMPPIQSHKTLTDQQVATLKRWIEQGAKWQEHWAFRAPVKPEFPPVRNTVWARTSIDRFILSKLESQGLMPAPAADARTLIRRVALDLTGLPPRPLEVEQFLKDTSPDAYERMVDRYLASPHYGEHRARYWLDAARYADTHGIHIDNYREIWPYRDWVIQALNRNMPFDQFSIEQLAGDLLPNATLEQKIATGFHRCNVTTSEGGAIDDEYYEIYAKDRADTTGAVWLGMTVGCATCHDHKFDPISQKDFYALGAFFRNTPQKAMDGNVADTPPILLVPPEQDRPAFDKLQQARASLRAEMQKAREAALSKIEGWLKERKPVTAPLGEDAELLAVNFAKLDLEDDVTLGDSDVAGRLALHFAKDEGLPLKDAPKIDADRPLSISTHFYLPPKFDRTYTIAAHTNPKEKSRGWLIQVNRGIATFRLTGDDGDGIEASASEVGQVRNGYWNHIAASYDGSREQAGMRLYLNGREVLTQGRGGVNAKLLGGVEVKDHPLQLGRALAGGVLSDLRLFNRVITESEVGVLREWPVIEGALARNADALSEQDRNALLTWYLANHDQPYRELSARLEKLNDGIYKIARESAITHVMYERPDAKPSAHILFRGAYDQKKQLVEASTPSVLPPMHSDLPRNRLGFARWLFTDEHPLTARVTVNRMWQEIFGTGIVKTADDFGSQGEPPSHPELLDWLAIDFRENGWDVKRFYKQIMMSAAYRQAALSTPEKVAKDPENRLLSRGPRFRMDAEMVRDYALGASGLLSRGIGGPSVRPYQPPGVWEAVAMSNSNTRFYKPDAGEGLYRRSMYTFWKRSAPPASMDIFNAPSREACTMRRERTNTPLQALVTMNDVQFLEAARFLAERAMLANVETPKRIAYVSDHILLRPLTPTEHGITQKAYKDYLTYYDGHPADAKKLLRNGERHADPTVPAPEYAALTMLANQLLNLDEVLNK